MKLHYLQHVFFETPGAILDWAKKNKIQATGAHLYKNEPLPSLDDFDFLLVMGGPMGVQDEHLYPWLSPEKKFIESAIKAGKKVVGICLGAQLVAHALGARVYKSAFKEIGWFPIDWSDEARRPGLFPHLPQTQEVFHWHGDMFDIPEGAVRLAKSVGCENQAFLYDEQVLGFQCHLEITEEIIRAAVKEGAVELVSAPYIQSAAEMLRRVNLCEPVNKTLSILLDKFVAI